MHIYLKLLTLQEQIQRLLILKTDDDVSIKAI